MNRGFADNLLVQLLFWAAVAMVGLYMLFSISCRVAKVC
jgi:hypothetical protein